MQNRFDARANRSSGWQRADTRIGAHVQMTHTHTVHRALFNDMAIARAARRACEAPCCEWPPPRARMHVRARARRPSSRACAHAAVRPVALAARARRRTHDVTRDTWSITHASRGCTRDARKGRSNAWRAARRCCKRVRTQRSGGCANASCTRSRSSTARRPPAASQPVSKSRTRS